MGQIVPRKYCRPGLRPEESREPCVPVNTSVDFAVAGTFIVSMQGETWFEADERMQDGLEADQNEPPRGKN